ncbi:MAG TPA: DUF72 domain-containing protein, partial [Acidimicrobiales bacterium]|nr:DUF72 domain-containing protein [Acidimicrobiales bacterium]
AIGPILALHHAEVRVGTCSWTDRTLVRETDWYPRRSMSAAERLAYYASQFPVAEADGTYYAPPSPELARQWVERTPPGFRMNVKAYSLLTGHPTRPASLWPDLRETLSEEDAAKTNVYAHHLTGEAVREAWDRFVGALRPLARAGKLGGVLLQYPRWFTPKRANRDGLRQARERLGELEAYVEFRSPRWLAEPEDRDRTLGLLSELGFAHVVVDAPAASGLAAVVAVTTPDLAVLRLHGRDDEAWSRPGATAAERFRYRYRDTELAELVPAVSTLAEQAREVHVLANNCYRDDGVRAAGDLVRLLAPSDGGEVADDR